MAYHYLSKSKVNFFYRYLSKNFKIMFLIVILVVYYEIKLYKISFGCEKSLKNEGFLGNEFLFGFSDKMNKLLRFGDEYQNFILSLLYHKNKNNTILLNSQDIDIIEDLNKY
jgi:hypothetical protein